MKKSIFTKFMSRVNTYINRSADSQSVEFSAEERQKLELQFGADAVNNLIEASNRFSAGEEDEGNKLVELFMEDVAAFGTEKVNALQEELAAERIKGEAYAANLKKVTDKVNILEKKAEGDPPVEKREINGTTKMPDTWKVKSHHSHIQALEDYRKTNHYAGDTVDIDDVQAEFGNLSDLGKIPVIDEVLRTFMTSSLLTWKFSDKDTYKATQGIISEIIQPFSADFTPKGKGTFTPIEIPLRHVGIDVKITPADVRDWIVQMYRENLDITMMPITRWFMESMRKKIIDDLERICGNGVYVEHDEALVSPGDVGKPAVDILDGYITQLKKKSADGGSNINFSLTDLVELTPENIIDSVHEFVDDIDELYAGVEMPIVCSYKTYKMYKRAYKERYGSESGDQNFGQDTIDYSVNRLVWLHSANGFGGLIATPKENFVGLRHINEPTNTRFDTQKQGRNVWVIGEFRFGIGYQIEEAIFAYIPNQGSGSGSAGIQSA